MPATRRRDAADVTWERVLAREGSVLLRIAEPWLVWLVLPGAAAAVRTFWPGWVAATALAAGGLLLGGLARHVAHHRTSPVGRWLGAVTCAAAFGWLAAVVWLGLTTALLGGWVIAGMITAAGWSIWLGPRDDDRAHHDLARLFETAAADARQEGVRVLRLIHRGAHAEALIANPPATTAAQFAKAVPAIEAAAGWPPGTIQADTDHDHAGHTKVTLSDPRVLARIHPWPGPSAAGASIAAPICPGIRQDSQPASYAVTNHHLQLMGMTGAGKTESGAWNELAETVTRRDAAVLGWDVTKGDQFLGPLRPALHALATTPDQARTLLEGVHRAVRARTDYLATRGLGRWQEDCGLTHLTCWLEEAPDVIALLSDDAEELWESDVKAGRSAGIRWAVSLQRSDWTQLPTIMRGQLARMCFGVRDDEDARFGLSPYQADHECHPELWADGRPGCYYLDAPTIPEQHKAMAQRGWWWGPDTSRIAAHAAAWPAAARPLDDVTAAALEGATVPLAGALRLVPDRTKEASVDSPVDNHDGLDGDGPPLEETPIPDDITVDPGSPLAGWQLNPGRRSRMDPAEARAELARAVDAWEAQGHGSFGVADLAPVLETTGRSRTWLYAALDELGDTGRVIRDKDAYPARWRIIRAA